MNSLIVQNITIFKELKISNRAKGFGIRENSAPSCHHHPLESLICSLTPKIRQLLPQLLKITLLGFQSSKFVRGASPNNREQRQPPMAMPQPMGPTCVHNSSDFPLYKKIPSLGFTISQV